MAALTLRPYQDEAATFLYERDRAMILAPVGAGKTALTLTALRDMVRDGVCKRALIVAPLRVATNVWPVEAVKWAPSLKVAVACGSPKARATAAYSDSDLLVVNYDNLQWLAELALTFDVVVFDELTKLKNASGKRFKACERLIGKTPVRWGLTGSFTSNGLEDVFGQCKIIDETMLGKRKGVFQQQYFSWRNRDTYVEYEPLPGALEKVMDRIKPWTYVLDAGQYKDKLPPLHTVEVPVEMDLKPYTTMRKEFVLEFGDETAIATNAAVVTQKLQQLASGFIYTDAAHWLSTHKIDALEDLIQENQRAPIIIWYQYIAEYEALRRRFSHAVDVKQPGAIDCWNAGRVEILLAHPASAGHGLNLQHGGNLMAWMSLPWSLELYEQAVGRLHRSGQTRDVWNYVLQTTGTVDQKILTALKEKRTLADIALEELK